MSAFGPRWTRWPRGDAAIERRHVYSRFVRKHARVMAGTGSQAPRCLREPEREEQKMPLLFYFPLIVWIGMMEVMQAEMLPSKAGARS